MKSIPLVVRIKALKASAQSCIEANRGDGLAEPALDICDAILEELEPKEVAPPQEPKKKKPAAPKK